MSKLINIIDLELMYIERLTTCIIKIIIVTRHFMKGQAIFMMDFLKILLYLFIAFDDVLRLQAAIYDE